MSAVVVDLVEYAARRARASGLATRPVAPSCAVRAIERCGTSPNVSSGTHTDFCFWEGASGKRYVHHVFSLIECPLMPAANYVMVGRDVAGRRVALHVGTVEHDAQSLNLAEIRQRGATLGAKEVHIHLLGRDADGRQFVSEDIRAAVDGDRAAAATLLA